MAKPLRVEMPNTAAFIDACREAFGASQIDSAIKAGIDGQPTFYACENSQEIGTKPLPPGASFTVGQLYLKPRQSKGSRA